MRTLCDTRQIICPLLTVLPWRNGSVFGTTPVALTTKSQPNVFPLVSWTYSGHGSPVVGDKKRSRIRQTADTFYTWAAGQHSHHPLGEPLPHGWWAFPPHTDFPIKLCGGPDFMTAEIRKVICSIQRQTCTYAVQYFLNIPVFKKKNPRAYLL